MLNFIIVFVYFLLALPLIVGAIMKTSERPIPKWTIVLVIGGWTSLSIFLISMAVYREHLWFTDLGQTERYWTLFWLRLRLFLSAGVTAFALTLAWGLFNYRKVRKLEPKEDAKSWMLVATGGTAFLSALIFSFWARAKWETIAMHFNAEPFGLADPILAKDAGFYLFNLPFWQMLGGMLVVFFLIQILHTYLYILSSGEGERRSDGEEKRKEAGNILLPRMFLGCAFLLFTFAYLRYLAPYGFLTSARGAVVGITYVDVSLRLWVNNLLIVLLALSGIVLIAFPVFRSMKKRVLIGTGSVLLGTLLILYTIVPAIMQNYKVGPDEINLERPYIEHNISFTRQGFNIDEVTEYHIDPALAIKPMPGEENARIFDPQDILKETETLNNIRLADWRTLIDLFQERQTFRTYYVFNDVDIDRYVINGEYHQVMLAARELDQDLLDERAKNWVNTRLKFTHGYGVALVSVTEFHDGLPRLLLYNIPVHSDIPEINITRPEIYFGELTRTHVYVNTAEDEFSYGSGDHNIYTRYEGSAGIEIGSKLSLRRFALALKFDGLKAYTSGALSDDSRILFRRTIEERVKTLAPFLMFDHDPYFFEAEGGRLFWMWDAYTVSDKFPYSTPNDGINYIRNSVKVVLDTYGGDVNLYPWDEEDPVIRVWQNIFPGLFTPKSEMPEGIRAHVRYPESMFLIQARTYSTYHMTDPEVFFNKEDVWKFARERYHNNIIEMIPYYVITSLPQEDYQEFVLMTPLTPQGTPEHPRSQMIGWMCGRADGEHDGELRVYKFPKNRLTPGPFQVEGFIDSNKAISEKMTLWGQEGSTVIRGNLLAIPINETVLYVEPVYILPDDPPYTRLVQVIVSIGESTGWGETIDEALAQLFYKMGGDVKLPEDPDSPVIIDDDLAVLISAAKAHYDNYLALMGQGKLLQAAEELGKLKQVLEALDSKVDLTS